MLLHLSRIEDITVISTSVVQCNDGRGMSGHVPFQDMDVSHILASHAAKQYVLPG